MRKYLFLSLVSLLLLVLLPSAHSTTTIILPGNAPTTGSQLFFDDFTSSGFPLQWSNTNIVLAADTIQSGGFGLMLFRDHSLPHLAISLPLQYPRMSHLIHR